MSIRFTTSAIALAALFAATPGVAQTPPASHDYFVMDEGGYGTALEVADRSTVRLNGPRARVDFIFVFPRENSTDHTRQARVVEEYDCDSENSRSLSEVFETVSGTPVGSKTFSGGWSQVEANTPNSRLRAMTCNDFVDPLWRHSPDFEALKAEFLKKYGQN